MKMPELSLIEWQRRFGNEESCAEALTRVRWPDGFICPVCAGKAYSYITSRQIYQCSHCQHQTS
ncbi:MAG: transposase, partial [Deltaproteobacteria bacterium]|nr:transposase [Deltaproteobacteria bacterium]